MSRRTDFSHRLHQRGPAALAPVIALAIAALWAAAGMMQSPETQPAASAEPVRQGQIIRRIDFVGIKYVADGYARSIIKSQVGETFNPVVVEEDVNRLIKTNKFDSARAEPTVENGELVLVFRCVERPFVEAVEFNGNRKFKTKDLLPEVELAPGSPISEFSIRQAVENIERKYKEAGYYYIKVDVNRTRLTNDRVVEFQITEGPRVKVKKIRFTGNNSFTPRQLKPHIETKTYIWIFRTGEFDADRADRDCASLQRFYKDQGFLDARVGYKLDFTSDTDLTVIYEIDEGVRYAIKSITLKGNTVFPTDELLNLMKLKPGDYFLAEKLQNDLKSITDKYGENGYIYADVRSEWVYATEEGLVDLTININEEQQYRFGRIVIRGNSDTKDKVVRRELRFFPEELYNTVATREAQNRLVETRLFKTAVITPVGDQPHVRDALVKVEEAEANTILFGVGVTSNSGLVGSVTLENRNFDIADWPRNATELFKGRAFRGAGQTLRIQLEPGTQLMRGRIDFREPYLFDQDLGFSTSVYVFQRDREDWDERRIGFFFAFDKRFREGRLKNWAVEAAFKFENVKISDVHWEDPAQIRDADGTSWLNSIKGTIVRDTTDSRFLPTRGNRSSFSYEQFGALGGDWFFGRFTADTAQHFTLLTDSSNRKHVLSLGGTLGQIFGDAPVFEKYFGGGIGSIRGFEFRRVAPMARFISEKRVGGDFELLTNAEYSFPVWEETLRGVTFLDMGTIEENTEISQWRAAIGVGMRVYLKPFGPIPLAFDFAIPLSKGPDDDTQVFSFSFGTTF